MRKTGLMSLIDEFVEKPAEWLKAEGPLNDVVVSSRLRLARNITSYPFLQKLSPKAKNELIEAVSRAIEGSHEVKNVIYLRSADLSEMDNLFLLERHLVSREHASETGEKAVALTRDELISIMVLEEDHLRLQTFQSGLNLLAAWKKMNLLDDELEKKLHYSFSPNLGYLTACPTNVGTGLRASCMLHLPGLVLTKQVHKVLQALAKLNLAARGLYGEGTQATGNLFQFSNQMTLGQKEEEIIDNLERVIRQVVEHEKEARGHLLERKRTKIEDQIWRAAGTLKAARVISSSEATQLLSLLQLGVSMGMVQSGMTRQALNTLFLLVQPAHLQKAAKKELSSPERDEFRARLIREKLNGVEI